MSQTEPTVEWVMEAMRKLLADRWNNSDCVHAHDLWMKHQHAFEGSKQEVCNRISQVMIEMVGTTEPHHLFDPRSLYLYYHCPECDTEDTLYMFRRVPLHPATEMGADCEECGFETCELEKDVTLNEVHAEFHLRTDCPLYEVDPERYKAEGRAAAEEPAGKRGNKKTALDSPYVRDSVPTNQWVEGFREVRSRQRAEKGLADVLAHPVTKHAVDTLWKIRDLLQTADTSDPIIAEAIQMSVWPENLPWPRTLD